MTDHIRYTITVLKYYDGVADEADVNADVRATIVCEKVSFCNWSARGEVVWSATCANREEMKGGVKYHLSDTLAGINDIVELAREVTELVTMNAGNFIQAALIASGVDANTIELATGEEEELPF